MTKQAPSRVELLQTRLSLVAALSALNAEALKFIQTLGAIDMDRLRIELEQERSGASEQLVRDLHEVEMKAEAVRAASAECDERIAAVEREVEAVDRLLAAAE